MHEKAIAHLTAADPVLSELIARVGPCKLRAKRSQSPFQALVQAVAHQQLNGTAARTILNRVIALHPHRPFPTPDDLLGTHDDHLRAAGLSRAKVAAVKDICAKTLSGLVPPSRDLARLSDDEIVERLTAVRGVGRWTVEMLLIFKLGRLDVLPADDYGVQQGYALAYRKRQLPKPKQLLARSEPWRPYRSVVAWYLWRAVDLLRPSKGK
jgi:3-methyladenine DNA glycosylase/8-oxoguanine DNA glycosylase